MKLPPVDKMIDYLKQQPPETWCADTRTDYDGTHCVLGHIDEFLGVEGVSYEITGDINPTELAAVNNGTTSWGGRPYYDGVRTLPIDGGSIKARVLNYLEAHNVQG